MAQYYDSNLVHHGLHITQSQRLSEDINRRHFQQPYQSPIKMIELYNNSLLRIIRTWFLRDIMYNSCTWVDFFASVSHYAHDKQNLPHWESSEIVDYAGWPIDAPGVPTNSMPRDSWTPFWLKTDDCRRLENVLVLRYGSNPFKIHF